MALASVKEQRTTAESSSGLWIRAAVRFDFLPLFALNRRYAPSEALGIAAQVAVTLAGFAGIVVVFRPDSVHRWSPLDKLRLQLLLINSALPLAESLFGMLLLTFDPPPTSIWRWCSGVSFSAQVVVLVYMRNPRRRLFTRADMPAVNKYLFYGIAFITTVAVALQAINFAVWNRFWPFFALIFVHLVAALAQFVRMVLLPPHESSGR